jgi:uncharacterized oligopeptide transporter (OPT) family protein
MVPLSIASHSAAVLAQPCFPLIILSNIMAPRPVPQGRSFTIRGVVVGLIVGTVICAANVYFGLQTGWVSIMSMPASLMGYGTFKLLSPYLRFPFTPVENVLVQSVACGMAIMPLGCGFVGVVSCSTNRLRFKPSS